MKINKCMQPTIEIELEISAAGTIPDGSRPRKAPPWVIQGITVILWEKNENQP